MSTMVHPLLLLRLWMQQMWIELYQREVSPSTVFYYFLCAASFMYSSISQVKVCWRVHNCYYLARNNFTFFQEFSIKFNKVGQGKGSSSAFFPKTRQFLALQIFSLIVLICQIRCSSCQLRVITNVEKGNIFPKHKLLFMEDEHNLVVVSF